MDSLQSFGLLLLFLFCFHLSVTKSESRMVVGGSKTINLKRGEERLKRLIFELDEVKDFVKMPRSFKFFGKIQNTCKGYVSSSLPHVVGAVLIWTDRKSVV